MSGLEDLFLILPEKKMSLTNLDYVGKVRLYITLYC